MTTTETPRLDGTGRWIRTVVNRWPTALALGLAALTLSDSGDPNSAVAGLGEVLPLLPLLYLFVAKMRRPGTTWLAVAVGLAVVVAVRALDLVAPSTVLLVAALAVLVWGALAGQLRRGDPFRLQAIGMLVFGGLALVGLAVDPALGRYLVAAGWLGHGIWDFVHLYRNKVVARSFAEWCGVVDIIVAAELLFLV